MEPTRPALRLVEGTQETLRRQLVEALLNFRSAEARKLVDRLAHRGDLKAISAPRAGA